MAISITAQEKAILSRVSIPPRPQALLKITKEAKSPEPNVTKIAEAIAEDAAISAAVLQVVNSVAFRRAKEVESIRQAVMTLGIKRVFPLVRAVALRNALPENADLKEFWRSSSLVATACTLYSDLLGKNELTDNAYMLGLFHNAGVPIMLQAFDDYHDMLIKGITDGWEDIAELERLKYHTSHTTLGALLGQQWRLPKAMIEVIYYFHDVDGIFESGELSRVSLYLLAILKLARSSVDDLLRGEADTNEWLLVQEPLLEFLNIEENELEEMRIEVHERLMEHTE